MAPLTILVCPNQELMVPEVSVGLLVLKGNLQKLLLFSPSYLLTLSYTAVLVQKLKASDKLCGDTIAVTKRVSLERLKKERGVRVIFRSYHCRGENKVFPHVQETTMYNLGDAEVAAAREDDPLQSQQGLEYTGGLCCKQRHQR